MMGLGAPQKGEGGHPSSPSNRRSEDTDYSAATLLLHACALQLSFDVTVDVLHVPQPPPAGRIYAYIYTQLQLGGMCSCIDSACISTCSRGPVSILPCLMTDMGSS